MKKIILIFTIVFLLVGCNSNKYQYNDGIYIGQAEGHHGVIEVEVEVVNNRISRIDITKEQEIPGLKEIVYSKVPKTIIKKNTWKVDGISGATLTSDGLKNAVKDALKDEVKEQ